VLELYVTVAGNGELVGSSSSNELVVTVAAFKGLLNVADMVPVKATPVAPEAGVIEFIVGPASPPTDVVKMTSTQ
jgi:hypothetical protein